MKFFSMIMYGILISGVLSSNEFCNEKDGNFHILEAVRWKDVLFVMLDNFHAYRINPFKWDGTDFTVGAIEKAQNWENNTFNEETKFIFTVNHPNKGQNIMFVNRQLDNGVQIFTAKMIEFDDKMAEKVSTNKVVVDIYKCGSHPDQLKLCSLFAKFPNDNIDKQLLSISSFPNSNRNFPDRLFAYYRETPPKNQLKDCPNCYEMRRHLFVRRNVSVVNVMEPLWLVDNATDAMCVDLHGVVVNSSTALTDYKSKAVGYYFDLIEFFGTEYKVIRISIQKDMNVSPNVETLKSGHLRHVFKCKKPLGNIILIVFGVVFLFIIIIAIIGVIVWFILSTNKDYKSRSKSPKMKSRSDI